MKTAGMVLGIVGGAIGILIVLCIGLNFLVTPVTSETGITLYNPGENSTADTYSGSDSSSEAIETLPPAPAPKVVITGDDNNSYTEIYLLPLIFFLAVLIGSCLGLAGAIISRKKAAVGGVLMIIGAVLSLADIIGFMLLLLGGIFALVSPKQAADTAQA